MTSTVFAQITAGNWKHELPISQNPILELSYCALHQKWLHSSLTRQIR
jgi:hypothetical protein